MTCRRDLQVMDRIVAGIGPHFGEHLGVVVADGADVVLLSPAGLGIHDGLVIEESAPELLQFLRIRGNAHQNLLENQFDLDFLVISGIEILQAMVGELAAHGSEVVVALLEGFLQVRIGVDLHAGGLAELFQIGLVGLRVLDGHRLVRTPGRNHLRSERMLRNLFVVAEVVCRIVGGADHLHVEPLDERLAAEFLRGELGIALLEDLFRRRRAQELVDAEHAAQFQVRPVIQRVSHGIGNSLRPFLEGFPGGMLAAGEIVLGNAVRAHRTPLVVVSIVTVHKPELRDVAELDVLRDLLRHKVAMVIDDGHLLRVLVVKLPGGLRLEHEIRVDKTHIYWCFRVEESRGITPGSLWNKDYWFV